MKYFKRIDRQLQWKMKCQPKSACWIIFQNVRRCFLCITVWISWETFSNFPHLETSPNLYLHCSFSNQRHLNPAMSFVAIRGSESLSRNAICSHQCKNNFDAAHLWRKKIFKSLAITIIFIQFFHLQWDL